MRSAMGYCDFEIRTHAHAQTVNAIAHGNLRQQGKMRRRVFTCGWNAHEPGYPQTKVSPATLDETVGIHGKHTGFLRFRPRIDLHKKVGRAALRVTFFCKYTGKFRPVEGMNCIKHTDGFARLVGLQWTDKMHLRIGKPGEQGRPFLLRFLHPVFTKYTLPILQHRNDGISRKCFADGNQRHIDRVTARITRGCINLCTDSLEAIRGWYVVRCAHGQ